MVKSYFVLLILVNVFFVHCAKSIECESIDKKQQCSKNTNCRWCSDEWGCMSIKNTSNNNPYDCPACKYILFLFLFLFLFYYIITLNYIYYYYI